MKIVHKTRVKETAVNKPNVSSAFLLPNIGAGGHQSFKDAYTAAGSDDLPPIFATNGLDWEACIGTFTEGDPSTLERTQFSESSTGGLIDWSSGGDVEVWVEPPAMLIQSYEEQSYISGLGLVWNGDNSISVRTGKTHIESLGRCVVLDTMFTLSGLSLGVSAWYYVYIYETAGVAACEINSTPPNPVPFFGTAKSKTGDTSRRFLGALKTDDSGRVFNFVSISKGNFVETTYRMVECVVPPFRILGGIPKQTTRIPVEFTGIAPPYITEAVFVMLIIGAAIGAGPGSVTVSMGATSVTNRMAFIAGYVALSQYASNTMWLPVNMETTDFYWANEDSDTAGVILYLDASGFGYSR